MSVTKIPSRHFHSARWASDGATERASESSIFTKGRRGAEDGRTDGGTRTDGRTDAGEGKKIGAAAAEEETGREGGLEPGQHARGPAGLPTSCECEQHGMGPSIKNVWGGGWPKSRHGGVVRFVQNEDKGEGSKIPASILYGWSLRTHGAGRQTTS